MEVQLATEFCARATTVLIINRMLMGAHLITVNVQCHTTQ